MNVKQKTLAALLVLGIGMSGCNTNDNNSTPQIEDKKAVDGNKTVDEDNETDENRTATILGYIDSQHSDHNSTITVAQLKAITPALNGINDDYQDIYRSYIASTDINISSPATVDEVQSMIYEVNDLNLPEHAILDRSFFKKTNGIFEHRFVYLPVKNNTTGRTWLNNNLGADYANVDSSAYDPSQQATAIIDYLAAGSAFQWGRKADGHELMDWTPFHAPSYEGSDTILSYAGKGKYGETKTPADEPSHSLFILIIFSEDRELWRVNQDDTLWAGESSPNNVCPIGYRLPLNPNAGDDAPADDGKNEWYVEKSTWSSEDREGAFASELKLSVAGHRDRFTGRIWDMYGPVGVYWTGTKYYDTKYESENGKNGSVLWIETDEANSDDSSRKVDGHAVRCIKD